MEGLDGLNSIEDEVLRDWGTAVEYYYDKPRAFVEDILHAKPIKWQAEALDAIAVNNRISIRSGHGVGKSTLLSWVILWFVSTRYPSRTVCTAPSEHQLHNVLWAEVRYWYQRMDPAFRTFLRIGHDKIENLIAPKEAFAMTRTARKDQPEAFQGVHAKNVLLIADEASGVDDAIYEAGMGSMSTMGAKTLLAGNPTRPSGYFYDSQTKAKNRWWTRTVSCLDERVPHADPGYPAEIAEIYGEQSNVYRVRVLGEFPESEEFAVFTISMIDSAILREVEMTQTTWPVWALDVARGGDDLSALCKRQGNHILEPVKTWSGKDTVQLAGIVQQEYENTDEDMRPKEIFVDIIGVGAGCYDVAKNMGLPVRRCSWQERSATEEKRYRNQRAEMYWRARGWLSNQDVWLPKDPLLHAELFEIRYDFTTDGRTIIEEKKDVKARLKRSPDRADAFAMTFMGGRHMREETAPLMRHRYGRVKAGRRGSGWGA